ncbi:hypothetical protein IEU95_12610 [Hoyosella rhizosphaerae]|uniref:Transmembrane protein n=1 Tax=Hoyosella rhizosphaerae TaxID=1755582 RepID=A0A916XBW1_9ACTN|nr:hypothetical protein [Hoyosella rhizosphaerae]MBN4927678.1 hypothetical protein [Hoyosella rhizosphaerae]GGC62537.1 hypothetical protein GCM10011410_13730 [Hoyosella rhizosphaerae]
MVTALTLHRKLHWCAPIYGIFLSIIILSPLLRPGYLLHRDAVSTPRSFVTDTALGLGDTAPRAVPQDWFLALASQVLDGGIVVTGLIVFALIAASWGAIALVRTVWATPTGPRVGAESVAVTLTVWNPYVAERLLQGHWSLLLGYAALPWVVVAVVRAGQGTPGWWGLLAVSIAVAGFTPTGLVLAFITGIVAALAVSSATRWRVIGLLAGVSTVVASPWWLAATLTGDSGTSTLLGVEAFAARAETGLGTLGSLISLGGIWNADAVPLTRTAGLGVLATLWISFILVVGGWQLWKTTSRRLPLALGFLAACAVVGPAIVATGPGMRVFAHVVATVPGGGLLRDTHKWVALALPFYILCGAAATLWLCTIIGRRMAPTVLCVMLIVVLPDAAWGVGGALRPIQYPPGWAEVSAHFAESAQKGSVAVLPAGMFRHYSYGTGVVALDPTPRLISRDVFASGDLHVAGSVIPGEGERARTVEATLLAGAKPTQLADLGVQWVIDQPATPGVRGEAQRTLDQLSVVIDTEDVVLYANPEVATDLSASTVDRSLVIAAHIAWLLALVAGGLAAVWPGLRRLAAGREINN